MSTHAQNLGATEHDMTHSDQPVAPDGPMAVPARGRMQRLSAQARARAGQLNASATGSLNAARTMASQRFADLAHEIRAYPSGIRLDDLAASTAGAFERGVGYIQGKNISDMRRDAGALVRQNPVRSLLLGLGLGLLVARSLRR